MCARRSKAIQFKNIQNKSFPQRGKMKVVNAAIRFACAKKKQDLDLIQHYLHEKYTFKSLVRKRTFSHGYERFFCVSERYFLGGGVERVLIVMCE